MKQAIIDGKCTKTKLMLHQLLSAQLQFPDYYGNNLDALYDLLCEPGEVKIVIKNREELFNYLGDYADDFLLVLMDAVKENPKLWIEIKP